jgi:hypothetical protein
MRKQRLFSIPVVVLPVFLLFFAAVTVNATDDYKDPFFAGVLSWVMPGAGQIYAHSYTKGSLFVFGELIDKAALFGLIFYINDRYGRIPGGGQINWQGLNDTEKSMIISYAVLSAGFRIYTSLDAVYTTRRFNRLMGFSAGLRISPLPREGSGFGLNIELRRNL